MVVLCRERDPGCRAYWEVTSLVGGAGLVQERVFCSSVSSGRRIRGSAGEQNLLGRGWSGFLLPVQRGWWHNGENVEVNLPLLGPWVCNVDQPQGLFSFLGVEEQREEPEVKPYAFLPGRAEGTAAAGILDRKTPVQLRKKQRTEWRLGTRNLH
uniref:Uncharacterized protein n=1 Tax=Knipowitschia caucasica TaxID=637954 RepID=A0AAV2J1Y0_KNICA